MMLSDSSWQAMSDVSLRVSAGPAGPATERIDDHSERYVTFLNGKKADLRVLLEGSSDSVAYNRWYLNQTRMLPYG